MAEIDDALTALSHYFHQLGPDCSLLPIKYQKEYSDIEKSLNLTKTKSVSKETIDDSLKQLQLFLGDEGYGKSMLSQLNISCLSFLFFSGLLLVVKAEGGDAFKITFQQNILPCLTKIWTLEVDDCGDNYSLWKSWPLQSCSLILADNSELELETKISLISRLLKIYLPFTNPADHHQVDYCSFEKSEFDLRSQPFFSKLIQKGLLSPNKACRKQSVYILKQTIKFSSIYLQPSTEDVNEFIWNTEQKPKWLEAWKSFFLLLDAIQDGQAHIIEPMLGLFSFDGPLTFDWWVVLCNRAFSGDSAAIKRRVIEAILCLPPHKLEPSFVNGDFMRALDTTWLYSDDAPGLISCFGNSVTNFYHDFICACREADTSFDDSIHAFLSGIDCNIRAPTPALYMLQSLLLIESNPSPSSCPLSPQTMEILSKFAKNQRLFHNYKARKLAKSQLLAFIINQSDPLTIGFQTCSSLLTDLEDDEIKFADPQFSQILGWWQGKSGNLVQNVKILLEDYFMAAKQMEVEGRGSISSLLRMAKEFSTMITLTISDGFVECCMPLLQEIGKREKSYFSKFANFTLFMSVNRKISELSSGECNMFVALDVGNRLYDLIDDISSILLDHMDDISPILECDSQCIDILVECFQLFLEKASESPKEMVAYLDILTFEQLLPIISGERKEQDGEEEEKFSSKDYLDQISKIVTLKLADLSLKMIVKHKQRVFDIPQTCEKILFQTIAFEVEKSFDLSDAQIADWNMLQVQLSSAKWSLVATISSFAPLDAQQVAFRACLDRLDVSKYQSVLAIFGCLKNLVAENAMPVDLLQESIQISKFLIKETINTPNWLFLYSEAFIEYFFQSSLLAREGECLDLAEDVIEFFVKEIDRRNVTIKLAERLYDVLSVNESKSIRLHLIEKIKGLLVFGPDRPKDEELTTRHLQSTNCQDERISTKVNDIGCDYLVRVYMNRLLLLLDPLCPDDHSFALMMTDVLLDSLE